MKIEQNHRKMRYFDENKRNDTLGFGKFLQKSWQKRKKDERAIGTKGTIGTKMPFQGFINLFKFFTSAGHLWEAKLELESFRRGHQERTLLFWIRCIFRRKRKKIPTTVKSAFKDCATIICRIGLCESSRG
jgi:hypothetical protein